MTIPEFEADTCWNQTINVAKPTATLKSGDKTYGTPVPIRARVEEQFKIVESAPGTFRQTSHWISTDGDRTDTPGTKISIDDLDRIWLPGVDEADAKLARQLFELKDAVDIDGVLEHQEFRI